MLLRLVLALDRARALPLPRLDHRAMGQALRVTLISLCGTWSVALLGAGSQVMQQN